MSRHVLDARVLLFLNMTPSANQLTLEVFNQPTTGSLSSRMAYAIPLSGSLIGLKQCHRARTWTLRMNKASDPTLPASSAALKKAPFFILILRPPSTQIGEWPGLRHN